MDLGGEQASCQPCGETPLMPAEAHQQSGFHRQPHGNIVLATDGYRAFVPVAMPPPIGWSATLAVSLSTADQSIGRLAGS